MNPEFISSSTLLGRLKCERDRILMVLNYGTGVLPYADLHVCVVFSDVWSMAGRKLAISVFTQRILCVCVSTESLSHTSTIGIHSVYLSYGFSSKRSLISHAGLIVSVCVLCSFHFIVCIMGNTWLTHWPPAKSSRVVCEPSSDHRLRCDTPQQQSSPRFKSQNSATIARLPLIFFLFTHRSLHLLLPLDDSFSFYCRVRRWTACGATAA